MSVDFQHNMPIANGRSRQAQDIKTTGGLDVFSAESAEPPHIPGTV